jgi:hypothetical protein
MKCNRKTLLLQFPCKKKKRSWREHYTHAYTYIFEVVLKLSGSCPYVWVGCQKVQEGNFGRRKFFSHLILEEGVASKRALRSISFIFIIILKIHLTNTFEKSSHIYTNSTRRLYMINTMTSKIKFLTLVAVSVLFHKPVNNEIFPVHIRYKGTPTRSVSV